MTAWWLHYLFLEDSPCLQQAKVSEGTRVALPLAEDPSASIAQLSYQRPADPALLLAAVLWLVIFAAKTLLLLTKRRKPCYSGTGYFAGLRLREVFSQQHQRLSGLSEESKTNRVVDSRFKNTSPGKAAEVQALKGVGRLCINALRDSVPRTAVGCSPEVLIQHRLYLNLGKRKPHLYATLDFWIIIKHKA